MRVDTCIDMRVVYIGMCVNTCIDMHVDMRVSAHRCRHAVVVSEPDMCVDIYRHVYQPECTCM